MRKIPVTRRAETYVTENPVFSFKWFVRQELDLAYWCAASVLRIRKILGKMLARHRTNLFVGEVLYSAFLDGSRSPHSQGSSGSGLL
jgi:hypothetical protein